MAGNLSKVLEASKKRSKERKRKKEAARKKALKDAGKFKFDSDRFHRGTI